MIKRSTPLQGCFFFYGPAGMIVLMEQFIVYLALVLIGACFGSFAGASVWRLRARQLEEIGRAHV